MTTIYSGATYATTTATYFTSCPSTCTNWNGYKLNAVPWQGQSVKAEVSEPINAR